MAGGNALKALHMAEAVEAADSSNAEAAGIMLDANRMILDNAGRENFSEVRWLESEILRLETLVKERVQ